MFNFKHLLLYIKQPYAAGVIALLWFGLLAFSAIDPDLPIVSMMLLTIGSSLIVALLGMRSNS